MTKTAIARGTPVPQRMKLMITVQRACCGFGSTSATMPPEAAATIGATIGRSHVAVIVDRAVSWKYMLGVTGQLKGLRESLRNTGAGHT